jgi:hypothetical protein
MKSESFLVNLSFSGSVVLEQKIFKWLNPIFCIFVIIFPLKRTWSFTWRKLNFLYLSMIYTMFDWNWLPGSREEDFKTRSVFLLFCYYLPLEKRVVFHLKKFESSSLKDDLCHLCWKLLQWFWRRCRKCTILTDRETDDGQQAHLNFHSGELKRVSRLKLFVFYLFCLSSVYVVFI